MKKLSQSHIFTMIQLIYSQVFLLSLLSFILAVIIVILLNFVNDNGSNLIGVVISAIIAVTLSIFIIRTKRFQVFVQKRHQYQFPIADRPSLAFKSNQITRNAGNDIDTNKDNRSQSMQEFEHFTKMFQYVYEILDRDLISPFGKVHSYAAIPAGKYPSPYLWDSAFIAHIWKYWDRNIAIDIMKPFLEHQNSEGLCPQTILCNLLINYSITNPPLLAWVCAEVARMTGDYEQIRVLYPKLKKFHEFVYKERCKEGLFVWKHSYESGIDNSPRFTDASEKIKYDITHTWAIDLNVWMVLANKNMEDIAIHLSLKEDVEKYTALNRDLIKKINEFLWDDRSGFYFDYNYEKKEFIAIPTIFSVFPLFVNIVPEERQLKLLPKLRDPNMFNTLIPFPTVGRSTAEFEKDCWRGPVWINTAYIALKGLKNGFHLVNSEESGTLGKLYGELAYKLVKGVAETYINEGSIYEFYDPDRYDLIELSRKKGNRLKQITLGSKPVDKFAGWTGLVNTILIEDIIGYSRENNSVTFFPHLLMNWKNTEITLTIPQFGEKLLMQMNEQSEIKVELISKTSIFHFQGKNNQVLRMNPE